jgi:hypothetical protein
MSTRIIPVNTTIVDQVDFFQGDYFTRVENLSVSDLVLSLFNENAKLSWPLVSGVGLTNGQILSGGVYFSQIPNALGYYSVRFRPNAAGYWRMVLSYPAGVQASALDYDVVTTSMFPGSGSGGPGSGLNVSFTR